MASELKMNEVVVGKDGASKKATDKKTKKMRQRASDKSPSVGSPDLGRLRYFGADQPFDT